MAVVAGSCGSDMSSKTTTTVRRLPAQGAAALGAGEARRAHAKSPSGSAVCPSAAHVLDGVYHPERLTVLGRCRHAGGRVVKARVEDDGDLHLDIELEARFHKLLLPGNFGKQGGALVAEFMPRDHGHLPKPRRGDRISLIGAWVDDTQHDWAELHPVWAVSINDGAWHTSGPRFGGSPPEDRSVNALAGCRTRSHHRCSGY
jgi:hypothetical protein